MLGGAALNTMKYCRSNLGTDVQLVPLSYDLQADTSMKSLKLPSVEKVGIYWNNK